MVNKIDLALALLIVVQLVLTIFVWTLNPIIVSHQVLAAGYIASTLIILAIIVYVYYRGEDYDQEWVAMGIAMVALILLLTYLKGGVV
ncbi:MAG: hypothetical protein QXK95_03590 [Nitrososphaerota archaeon]|nr:hypothetical protein [Candidatus Geocrenenecus dongiae]